MLTEVERNWLDYAWRVVNCPDEHRAVCVAAGGAVPGPGRVDGNELRWPGYVGRKWIPGRGVLCVGAVHREADQAKHGGEVISRTNRELNEATRAWASRGRSTETDEVYLRAVQAAYVDALPTWERWNQHFRPLVNDLLKMNTDEIAWANLAKCRVSIDRGAHQQAAEQKVTRLCQQQFVPMSDLVAALRPAAVLCSVLRAGPGEGIVESWEGVEWSPMVITWFGRTGHDRYNKHPLRRAFSVWAPEAATAIRARQGR
jgi:hypothetical protein